MLAPIHDPYAYWSKSKGYSYVLTPEGKLVCTINPRGVAFRANDNLKAPMHHQHKFMANCNLGPGIGAIGAILPRPFSRMPSH